VTARVLVTGCSTGIGRATAIELHRRGFEVVATARRMENIEDLDVHQRFELDIDDDASVNRAVELAGAIDALVNNAGFGVRGPIETVPLHEVRRLFETNVFGSLRMMQAFVPQMRERGSGTIVNLSSAAARMTNVLIGFYSASKAALEAMSEALRYEVGPFGVRVVIVEPGAVETDFGSRRVHVGYERPPYDALGRAADAGLERIMTKPDSSEVIAEAIADLLDAAAPPLRCVPGTHAARTLAKRALLTDEQFEEQVHRGLAG